MAMTNAERQARWRARQQAERAAIADHPEAELIPRPEVDRLIANALAAERARIKREIELTTKSVAQHIADLELSQKMLEAAGRGPR